MKNKKDEDDNKAVTKKDFVLGMNEFKVGMNEFKERMDTFEVRMEKVEIGVHNLQIDVHNLQIDVIIIREDIKVIREEMYTKKDHEIFMVYMDEAMKELRDAREERILHENQFLRMDDHVSNHEKRIRVLEKKY
jgi:hypothetical protein